MKVAGAIVTQGVRAVIRGRPPDRGVRPGLLGQHRPDDGDRDVPGDRPSGAHRRMAGVVVDGPGERPHQRRRARRDGHAGPCAAASPARRPAARVRRPRRGGAGFSRGGRRAGREGHLSRAEWAALQRRARRTPAGGCAAILDRLRTDHAAHDLRPARGSARGRHRSGRQLRAFADSSSRSSTPAGGHRPPTSVTSLVPTGPSTLTYNPRSASMPGLVRRSCAGAATTRGCSAAARCGWRCPGGAGPDLAAVPAGPESTVRGALPPGRCNWRYPSGAAVSDAEAALEVAMPRPPSGPCAGNWARTGGSGCSRPANSPRSRYTTRSGPTPPPRRARRSTPWATRSARPGRFARPCRPGRTWPCSGCGSPSSAPTRHAS